MESDSVFDKYRAGVAPILSAFRLFSTDVSCEEDSSLSENERGKIRGCYRKYTQEEK